MTKRILDILIAGISISILIIPSILIWCLVKFTSPGPGIYWSQRIGRNGTIFKMPKFRTMYVKTPEVATDKLSCPEQYITPVGERLRNTSLDEIPQLFSVLIGDMSIVGPRPALHNQHQLIKKRKKLQIDTLRPGITGWAQINGRDDISLPKKIYLDQQYLKNQATIFDFKIIFRTILLLITSKNNIE